MKRKSANISKNQSTLYWNYLFKILSQYILSALGGKNWVLFIFVTSAFGAIPDPQRGTVWTEPRAVQFSIFYSFFPPNKKRQYVYDSI